MPRNGSKDTFRAGLTVRVIGPNGERSVRTVARVFGSGRFTLEGQGKTLFVRVSDTLVAEYAPAPEEPPKLPEIVPMLTPPEPLRLEDHRVTPLPPLWTVPQVPTPAADIYAQVTTMTPPPLPRVVGSSPALSAPYEPEQPTRSPTMHDLPWAGVLIGIVGVFSFIGAIALKIWGR